MERRNGFLVEMLDATHTIYFSTFWNMSNYKNTIHPIFEGLNFPLFPQYSSIENVVSLTTKYIIFCSGIAILILIYFSVQIVQYRNVSGAVSIPIFLSKNVAHATAISLSHEIYLCENEKPNSLYYFAIKQLRRNIIKTSLRKSLEYCAE